MSPITSGLLLMTIGAFLIGGAISFKRQKISVIAQIILWVVALAFFAYGFYVVTLA